MNKTCRIISLGFERGVICVMSLCRDISFHAIVMYEPCLATSCDSNTTVIFNDMMDFLILRVYPAFHITSLNPSLSVIYASSLLGAE